MDHVVRRGPRTRHWWGKSNLHGCTIPCARGALVRRRRGRSVDLGHERLLLHRRAHVATGRRWARRQLDWLRRQIAVGDLRQQMVDAVQPGVTLVVCVDHPPWGLLGVGVCEHLVLGARVVLPAVAGLDVHRRQLPAFGGIVEPGLEAFLLLLVAHREPVLDQDGAGTDQHALELRTRAHELLHLLVAGEAHHALDARAVVPGAVEQNHLAGSRQLLDVALEVPLSPLTVARRAEGDDAHDPGVGGFGDARDHAALAGRVTTLEDHDDAQSLVPDPLLELDQFDLQPSEFGLVDLPLEATPAGIGFRPEALAHPAHDRVLRWTRTASSRERLRASRAQRHIT